MKQYDMEEEKVKLHRPSNDADFKQSKLEKDIMAYVVLFQCSKATAYALFNPHLTDRDGKLNKAGQKECRMFFSHPKNEEYMEALSAHLKSLMKGTNVAIASSELSDDRIDNAFKVFLKQAIEDIENGKEIDNDTFKILMELFKKLGRFKDDVEQQIKPIRVLPTRCKSECRYRAFVETHKAEGILFDDCDYCKARVFAEEHGFKYDPCTVLDVPQSVIDEIDSKNDVKLTDILSGKVEN